MSKLGIVLDIILTKNNWVTISNVQFQYDHLHPIVLILRHSKNMSLCHHVRYRIIRSEPDP
jgi:hypothetical protein